MNSCIEKSQRSPKRALKRINTIHWKNWDPIGASVPEDEYEGYAPPILRVLLDGADKAALSNYLFVTAADTIKSPITRDHADRVAQMLLDLGLA